MENNQFQNNQQFGQQQFSQPVQQQYVQPQAYVPVKQKNGISFDFLSGPDKNKFIYAGVARVAISVALGILSLIYDLIVTNAYLGNAGSAVASIYNIITSVVTVAIACVFGYMAYKEIVSSLKFAGIVILSGYAGTVISSIIGTVLYFILSLASAYGTIYSVVSFFIGVIAVVVSVVAAVALMAVVENKIDLSKFISSKPQVPAGGIYNPVQMHVQNYSVPNNINAQEESTAAVASDASASGYQSKQL